MRHSWCIQTFDPFVAIAGEFTERLDSRQQLYDLGDGLDSLSEQHPLVSEELSPSREAFVHRHFVGGAGWRDENTPLAGLDPANA